MAKGSVRKKGKKWYYRFYVEDASGKEGTDLFNEGEAEKTNPLTREMYNG